MKKWDKQLIFCGVYCILGLLGFVADFGIFRGVISTRPFVLYTSLSNMLCSAFMAISLIRKLRYGEMAWWPLGKYLFVVMILVTAIVYNLLLSPYKSLISYFASFKNALYHLILPVMFFLDWILFYRRGTAKPHYPLLAMGIPLLYVTYILLRAFVVKATGITVSTLYPYFFLDIDRLGVQGFLRWMGILLVLLLLLAYGLYGLDRYLLRRRKHLEQSHADMR